MLMELAPSARAFCTDPAVTAAAASKLSICLLGTAASSALALTMKHCALLLDTGAAAKAREALVAALPISTFWKAATEVEARAMVEEAMATRLLEHEDAAPLSVGYFS
jgi:hypothetical protein